MAWASPSADYDNDGRDDVYITALDGDHLFHNEGNGKFRDVTQGSRNPQRQLRHQRRLAGLRPRRQARSVRRQLRAMDRRRAILVLAGRRDQVLLHAGILQGHVARGCFTTWATASSKMSARKPGVATPPASRWASRCSITTTMAGRTVRLQRHPAQQALPQHRQRHVHGRRHGGRRGVRRRRRGARRHGRRMPPITTAAAARTCWSGNFSNQMLALYHNEGNGIFVDEAPSSALGAIEPAHADLRRLLLRLRSGWLAGYLLRQWPHRGRDRPRAAQDSIQGSRRCCLPQRWQRQVREREQLSWARRLTRPWWHAAPPTPISTATAIWTWSSPPTTARPMCFATTAAIGTTGLRVKTIGNKIQPRRTWRLGAQ